MIGFLWVLNFAISVLNAWGVGKTWTETKAVGGPVHFMSWMGAVMAAVGFTWCYGVIFAGLASQIPITNEVTGVSAPILGPEEVAVFADLVYLTLIFPLVGSGMAIMTHSWGVFWRRRSVTDGVVAGWNTYANLSNFYHAVEHVPNAMSNVGSFFSRSSSSSSDNDSGKAVLILALAAVFAGVLTTVLIIRSVARSTALSRSIRYDEVRA